MSEKINDGGHAFPVTFEGGSNNGESPYFETGMTLRDWFATHAPKPPATWWGGGGITCAGYAMWNYQYADAMIFAREVKP